jgi:hypothetical protein
MVFNKADADYFVGVWMTHCQADLSAAGDLTNSKTPMNVNEGSLYSIRNN